MKAFVIHATLLSLSSTRLVLRTDELDVAHSVDALQYLLFGLRSLAYMTELRTD